MTGNRSGLRHSELVSGSTSPSGSQDGDANAAACYGIDTVHSWATVSAAGQQLSAWRSDADLHGGAQTVYMETSPAVTRPALCAAGSVPDVRVHTDANSPVAPPRTKRKARAPLPATFKTSSDKGIISLCYL